MTILYGKFHKKVLKSIEYDFDLRYFRSNKIIKFPTENHYSEGDGTLTTESMLIPGLKWAKEFEEK